MISICIVFRLLVDIGHDGIECGDESFNRFLCGSRVSSHRNTDLFANLGFTVVRTASEIEFALTLGQIVEITTNISALALFIASIIMLLGTFARTQREAGVYTSPLIFVSIFLAVFSFSSSDFSTPMYAVPILGNSLAMKDTLLGVLSPINLAVTVATNVVLSAALVEGSVALYERESVLFRP